MADFACALLRRLCASLLAASMLCWGACIPNTALLPNSGLTQNQQPNLVRVPGGFVNTAGGNLLVRRVDLSLDTVLGTQEIAAVYNSTSGRWLWNFQVSYDGSRFEDASGAVWDGGEYAAGLPPDFPIHGTVWVRVDGDTLATRGGLARHFDGQGRLSHISWTSMDYPRIEFGDDEIRQCISAANCSVLYTLVLDPSGNPLSVTDARTGRRAEFGYDALGRLVQARDALDVEQGWPGFRYEYDGLGTLLSAVTNSEGERIEYAWQGERRIRDVVQVGEGDPTHRFEFYGKDTALARWPTVHENPLGGRTRYRFDRYRRLRSLELEATGETSWIEWGENTARPSAITAPSGAVTRYTVDVNDDVVEIVEPSGNVISFSYESGAIDPDHPFSRPSRRIEDSVGLIADLSYDAEGRLIRLETAEGETFESTYDTATRTSLSLPFGDPISFDTYGIHGHWIDASVPSSPFPVRRAFDLVGNLLVPAAGLQEGGVLQRAYDGDRNVARIDVAASDAGSVTSQDSVVIGRRSDGRPTAIERPLGADHELVYDALGRPVLLREAVDGGWQETSFEYDAAGNLTARQRVNGMRDEFAYDAYGRLTRRAALRDGVLEGEALITYQGGLPASFSDSTRGTTELYGYDAAGRLASVAWSSGESISLAYDLRSRVTSKTYDLPGVGSRSIGYVYDGADRQTRVTLDSTETLLELFYADAKEVSVHYGNGLVRDAQYDPATGQLTGFTTTDPVAGVVETTTLSRTVDAGAGQFEVASSTTTSLAATQESYLLGLAGSLSDIDKLVGNRVFRWSDHAGSSKNYVYDALSNLQSNGVGDSFGYNAERNRLLSATLAHEGRTLDYGYDEAGFATSRDGVPLNWSASGNLASYGIIALEWDLVNRPISVSAGPLQRDFVLFGGAVSSDPYTGAVGAIDLGPVQVPFAGGERIYRHFDFRHNVSFVSDETGEIVTHYWYSAYGLEGIEGVGVDTRRFAANHDLGDGLVLMGLRVYDALAGRFLSPDPLLQELNQFGYTLGNPVHFIDRDGAQQEAQGDPSSSADHPVEIAAAAVLVLLAVAAPIAVVAGAPVVATYLAMAAAGISAGLVWSRIQAYRRRAEAAQPGDAASRPGGAPGNDDSDPLTSDDPGAVSFGGSFGDPSTGNLYSINTNFPAVEGPINCAGSPTALAGADPRATLPHVLVIGLLSAWLAFLRLRQRGRRRP